MSVSCRDIATKGRKIQVDAGKDKKAKWHSSCPVNEVFNYLDYLPRTVPR